MNEKEKLIELIIEDLEHTGGDCLLCNKMGWQCPVIIPNETSEMFIPDLSVCNFREQLHKTLTIEH